MKRKAIFILLALLMLGALGYLYINYIFIPGKFKTIVSEKLRETLNREVSFDSIHYSFISGFTIKNLKIMETGGPKPFVELKELSFNILFLPFIKSKTVIIATIKFTDPFIHLKQDSARVWNFTDLLSKIQSPQPSQGKSSNINLIVRKVILKNGKIGIISLSGAEAFTQTIQNINLAAVVSQDKKIRLQLNGQIPENQTALTVKGTYDAADQKFSAAVTISNAALKPYLTMINPGTPFLKDATIVSATFNMSYDKSLWKLWGNCLIHNTLLQLNLQRYVAAEIKAENISLNWQNKKLRGQADVFIPAANLLVNPNVHLISDITAHLGKILVNGRDVMIQGDVTLAGSNLQIMDDRTLTGELKGTQLTFIKKGNNFYLKGNFGCEHPDFKLGKDYALSQGEIALTDTTLNWDRETFKLSTLMKAGHADIIFKNRPVKGDVSSDKFALTFENHELNLSAFARIDNADIMLSSSLRLQGNPSFKIDYFFKGAETRTIGYTGTLSLTYGQLTGIPQFEEATNLNGEVRFEPDRLQTDSLRFNTRGTDIDLSGSLSNFSRPRADIEARVQQMNLDKMVLFFPELKNYPDITYSGSLTGTLKYNGPLNNPQAAQLNFSGDIENGAVNFGKSQKKVDRIQGGIQYNPDAVSFDKLKGQYQNTVYTLDGKITNFAQPFLTTTISSKQMQATLMANALKEKWQIVTLKGAYLNSLFDLKGEVASLQETPIIALGGQITLALSDLKELLPKWSEEIGEFNLQGNLLGRVEFNGSTDNLQNAAISVNTSANRISVMDHDFEKVTLDFVQKDRKITSCRLALDLYGGSLVFRTTADLAEKLIPIETFLAVEDVDLSNLQTHKKIKNKDIAGLLNLDVTLIGSLFDTTTLKGQGSISVVDGNMWQWTLIQGIWGILLIPEFKNVVFTDIQSDFSVNEGKIVTEDTLLKSDAVDLRLKGWIDFDRNINFEVSPKFSEIAILKSRASLKKGITSFLLTGGAISIKADGTLENPKYHMGALPIKVLEKTTGVIKDGIEGIFQEIF